MTQAFTTRNWKARLIKHPCEEAYSFDYSPRSVAVADGVTRDPMPFLPDTRTLLGKLKFAKHYPKDSPAKHAADIFCRKFPEVLRDFTDKSQEAIKKAFEEANTTINYWNKHCNPEPDYIMNDFAGCVASGTVLRGNYVHWGFITDCGVAVFDAKGDLKFRTENQGPDKHDRHIWQDPRLKNASWSNPETRRIIRSEYRNNPDEPHSFGVLTGERNAIYYVQTGTQEIKPGEHLLVYSGGLEPIIFSGRFSDLLRTRNVRDIERLCKRKVRTEGTLALTTKH